MYKFAILLISCFLAINNPVQGGSNKDKAEKSVQGDPTEDEAALSRDKVLEIIFRQYQEHVKFWNTDLFPNQLLEFLGDDEISKAVFDGYVKDNKFDDIEQQNYINEDRFKEILKIVSKAHGEDVVTFAQKCFENAKINDKTMEIAGITLHE